MCDSRLDHFGLSRSGLTRLVDRLARDGLIERVACHDDARGAWRLANAARAREAPRRTRARSPACGGCFLLPSLQDQEALAAIWDRLGTGGSSRCQP